MKGRHPKSLKWELYCAGTRVRCYWCPRMLTFAEATVDHEPPLATGGEPRRAVLACNECNQKRGRETDRAVKEARGNGGKNHKPRKRRSP